MNLSSKITSDRVSELHFPKLTIKSKNCALLHCFPKKLPKDRIENVLMRYDVRQSYLYMSGTGCGIALLYRSSTVSGIREVKEICIDRNGRIAKNGKISICRGRRAGLKYCWCSDVNKESLSGRELMKGTEFNPLPCPFGLHIIFEDPNSIIRVLDNEISTLVVAACNIESIYITANEEQLGGELAQEATIGRKIVYYPKFGEYEKALAMKVRLAEKGVKISVSLFMKNITFEEKAIGSDISDYIRMEMSRGKAYTELMEHIFNVDPELESSGNSLW